MNHGSEEGGQRFSPTVLAATALGALILLITSMMFFGSRSSEDDRLIGSEVSTAQAEPSERCASRTVYNQIKLELFRQASAARGGDQAAFDKIASYSNARMEAPVLRDESTGGVTCNGTLTIDLPPGVAAAGARRSLSADILYLIEAGGGVTVSNADEIVTPLATLSRTADASNDLFPPDANEIAPAEPGNTAMIEELPPADGPEPADPSDAAAISPSFNCANAATSGEVAVCNDDRLALLDRRMAAQFSSAFSHADARQRALLARTRESFLVHRDRCTSNDCIAETYRGRMREIRDIMLGRWTPQR